MSEEAALTVATEEEELQVQELRKIFDEFDRDGDGSLTQIELGSLLRSIGLKPNSQQLECLVQKADKNNNGLVEFTELLDLIAPDLSSSPSPSSPTPPAPYDEKQMRALFRAFDRDGNGFISAPELAHSMARLGHPLTVTELTDMIREADTDGDGKISFEEFVAAITYSRFMS